MSYKTYDFWAYFSFFKRTIKRGGKNQPKNTPKNRGLTSKVKNSNLSFTFIEKHKAKKGGKIKFEYMGLNNLLLLL